MMGMVDQGLGMMDMEVTDMIITEAVGIMKEDKFW
jgi:hypothetical protein